MDIRNWLEREGYASNYPGEWIVVSGPSAHTLEYHGKQREDAMDAIELVRKNTPGFWAVAIKIPDKQDAESSE